MSRKKSPVHLWNTVREQQKWNQNNEIKSWNKVAMCGSNWPQNQWGCQCCPRFAWLLYICQTDLWISEGGHAVPVSRDYYTYDKLTSESVRVSMLSPFRVIIIHMPNWPQNQWGCPCCPRFAWLFCSQNVSPSGGGSGSCSLQIKTIIFIFFKN